MFSNLSSFDDGKKMFLAILPIECFNESEKNEIAIQKPLIWEPYRRVITSAFRKKIVRSKRTKLAEPTSRIRNNALGYSWANIQ